MQLGYSFSFLFLDCKLLLFLISVHFKTVAPVYLSAFLFTQTVYLNDFWKPEDTKVSRISRKTATSLIKKNGVFLSHHFKYAVAPQIPLWTPLDHIL